MCWSILQHVWKLFLKDQYCIRVEIFDMALSISMDFQFSFLSSRFYKSCILLPEKCEISTFEILIDFVYKLLLSTTGWLHTNSNMLKYNFLNCPKIRPLFIRWNDYLSKGILYTAIDTTLVDWTDSINKFPYEIAYNMQLRKKP